MDGDTESAAQIATVRCVGKSRTPCKDITAWESSDDEGVLAVHVFERRFVVVQEAYRDAMQFEHVLANRSGVASIQVVGGVAAIMPGIVAQRGDCKPQTRSDFSRYRGV